MWRIKAWLAALGAFVAALFAAYLRGRSAGVAAEHERELNEYVETRRRMDDATIPHDAKDALDWLKSRGMRDGGK